MEYFCLGIQFLATLLLLFFCVKQNDRIQDITDSIKRLDRRMKAIKGRKPTFEELEESVNELFKKIREVQEIEND